MRCQNCVRHVEDHETMVKRTIQVNFFQSQDKLICLDCVQKFDEDYAKIIRMRRLFIFGIITVQIIVTSFLLIWLLR
jgi:hypothetical protein